MADYLVPEYLAFIAYSVLGIKTITNVHRREGNEMDMETSRLSLKAITTDMGKQLVRFPITFFYEQEISYVTDWPSNALKAELPLYLENLATGQTSFGFGPWIVHTKYEQEMVGDIFIRQTTPDAAQAELFFHIREEMAGKRYEEEAIVSICDWLLQQGVDIIHAFCKPQEAEKQQVLTRCGFHKLGQVDGLIQFRTYGHLLPADGL
ncbi:Protein N-acetyltransferase, RimJ/RimL family [Terribacillus aidingensis]|uniref:Protein N-acetyltransferase, RimJ/RimL family n=1 Tax=Terribacillus aidingensis TaxID=586416 RepID=A0A285NIG7_9BACI|nr:GNAT family N-acetyltransferase [Terribacillus aidingensis]SNZ09302.1 Protein N-acetyltransferase, RimJ/RimL family [Terribacillus aidingensis]